MDRSYLVTQPREATTESREASGVRGLPALSLCFVWLSATLAFSPGASHAQDFLKPLPAYERYQKISRETTNAVSTGARSINWKDGGKAVEYRIDDKRFRYDIPSGKITELGSAPAGDNQEPAETGREGRRNRQDR